MTALWTSDYAAAATGGCATRPWQAHSVSIDSRTLEPGALFVALKDVRDGHEFVADALKRGAAAAMVSRVPEGLAEDAPLLIVDDVLRGLEALASAARARTTAKVIGITGSVGKTSTKEMLRAILAGQGKVHAAEKSYNNHWGVPLTLARMPADADFAVIEIGMNHPGEIAPLARLADLDAALVTTVAPAHLAAFGRVENIAREKASIMQGLRPGGVAVLNADIPTSETLFDAARTRGARIVGFGEKGSEATLLVSTPQNGQTVAQARMTGPDGAVHPLLFKLQSPGKHFAMNGLAALAVAAALGVDLALAAGDLGRWAPYEGRGARETILLDIVHDGMTLELIDDSYNANPASVGAALDMLAAIAPVDGIGRVSRGRRIAILGDMLELGADEMTLHAALAEHPAMASVDVIHCVGARSHALWEALPAERRGQWCQDSAEMAAEMRHLLDAGDIVLVKGSLGIRLSRVVDAIRKLGQVRPQET
ncbi:UDP-N-acetylmuramoyl-tripeptide--D-alanyl-D-alanine ligase [Tropicimonas isoalkanivorans]|uniref:UDP-N-acetylmuramoyl-tripeptide--D-alanyl-D-alanine ligase n=1 Tax=Tropicimonas isoalkanivorans TaxID=441112 RepID=A0A1I1G4N2_9RHOB|nr:UDP-N-acetylmuramoyl-tripeptide--D-alanyl-D-alanine ligase [Tropicimonas isoalkanivorans]SFC06799.1 UDP-N-acetylmuramoyl-tripeptide--D-alanyl-D-alanine ligase [Tropicimonas isoalkanivorans]